MKAAIIVLCLALAALPLVALVRDCGDMGEPELPEGAEGAGQSFLAPRDGTRGPGAPHGAVRRRNPGEPDPLADVLAAILQDAARGEPDEAAQRVLAERLRVVLDSEQLGTAEARQRAATVTVQDMVQRAGQARASGAPLDQMNTRAVRALAQDMAAQLRSTLPAGHDPGALRAIAPMAEVPAGYTRVDWKRLGGFDYEPGGRLPSSVRELDGTKIGISGFVLPLDVIDDTYQFLVVESLWDCCFGAPPGLHQGVMVRYRSLESDFVDVPVLVLGALSVGEQRDESGEVVSVYRIDADEVVALEPQEP